MTTGAYCDNAGCSHEFDKPSFAEILARKRECPACGAVNYVSDDLGTALDKAFAEVAAGTTVPQEMRKTAVEANTAPKRIVGTLVYSAAGKVFRCSCGCNVFQKLDPDFPEAYTCNACGTTYEGI